MFPGETFPPGARTPGRRALLAYRTGGGKTQVQHGRVVSQQGGTENTEKQAPKPLTDFRLRVLRHPPRSPCPLCFLGTDYSPLPMIRLAFSCK